MPTDLTPVEEMPAAEVLPARREEPSVGSLLELAINRDVDVAMLERLVALKERVEARDARASYFAALAKFQEECPEIPKTKTARITTRNGGGFDYSYAPLDVCARHMRPHLKANGFSYSWDVDLSPQGGALIIGCTLRHIDGHSERATFPVPIDKSNPATSDAQKNGAALTYGKRQTLLAVTGITTADEDVDAAKVDGEIRSDERISAQQAADLDDLIAETQSNKARFLALFEIEKVADLPASEYRRAVHFLNQRRGGAQ